MIPLEHVLAVALLLGPPSDAPKGPTPPHIVALGPTVREVARFWQLADSREAHLLLGEAHDFHLDLNLLQQRRRDLAEAPLISDIDLFPMRQVICEFLEFNRAFHTHITRRHQGEGNTCQDLDAVLAETDRLYRIWDTLRDARTESFYITVRRQALMQLRDMIGGRAYSLAVLPPHVPVWRFERRD